MRIDRPNPQPPGFPPSLCPCHPCTHAVNPLPIAPMRTVGPDAVTLLVREFELPYLTTHLAFVSGLVSFMSSIGLRAWIQVCWNELEAQT